MGRSNNNTHNPNLISGESTQGFLPSFPNVSNHHLSHHHHGHSNMHPHHHHLQPNSQLPSPPSSAAALSHSQYIGHLTVGPPNIYEANNLTPPARVYSPFSHGSNSSTGSGHSGLSYGSNNGHNNNNDVGPMPESMPMAALKYEYEDYPQEPDGGPVKINTWKEHVAVFSMDQVGVMCDVLLQEDDMQRLVELLSTVGKEFIGRSEKILRAQAHVAFHSAKQDARKFPQVYKILETNTFSQQYHAGLQKLWFQSHYKEAEITRGRALGAVDKYRIRKKFQLPKTIWDGEETVYCFKERSRNALRESFRLEKYPNLEEKKKLSKLTDLTMTQVGNWFKNKRQREKEKQQGKADIKRSRNAYPSSGIATPINPALLGMMLNPGVNQSHGHLHPHPQQHIAPVSPEEFENSIRKARFDEARLKSYMDDGIYTGSPASSNLSSYLHSNNVSNGARHMVLPGKSDITIGIVGSPGGAHHQQSPRSNNGLTITAVHSPNNAQSHQHHHNHPHHQHHSPGEGGNVDISPGNSPIGNSETNGSAGPYRPRSNSSANGVRCGAELVPYLQSHHHLYHPQHHQSIGSPIPGYEGMAPLLHNGSSVALSHA